MRTSARRPLYWLLFILFCLAVTLAVYGSSLGLPFFFDDFVHYPFVEANNIARIWLTTDELAYYRPVNFSVWRVTYELFQRHNAGVDHAINLVIFAASGVMVGWLAGRLWGLRGDRFPVVQNMREADDWGRILISATLFLLFPFSYQAVPWIGSLSHITVTALILLSVLLFVQMRRTRQRAWGAAGLFVAFLAPFAHENGVLVMPFVVLVDLTTPGLADRWRRSLRTAVIWSLPLLLYVPIWLSLPRSNGDGLFSNSLEGVLQNSAYFVQGAFYPFTRLGGWLHYEQGVGDMATVGYLSAVGLAIAVLVQIAHHASLRSLMSWLWIALASLPAVLFLVFDYVINGPRLLMVASVGAAWLWTDVILLFSRGGGRGPVERLLRVTTAALFTVLLLVQNVTFLRDRMVMHEILGDGFAQIEAATMAANDAGQEAIIINFPSWLAPKNAAFALGHEGVLFWPDYVPPEIFMAVHTGEMGALNFARVDGIRSDLESYHYGLTGPSADWKTLSSVPAQVLRSDYGPRSVRLNPVGLVGSYRHDTFPALATFAALGTETAVQLLDVTVQTNEGGLQVDSLWQANGAPPQTTIFLHVLDGEGNLVAQADGDPLGGSYPLDQWPADGRVLDSRTIPFTAAGDKSLRIGVYDRVTGQRLEAAGANGEALPDNAFALDLAAP